MGVGPTWGRFPNCPKMSRFVPVCPPLSLLGPGTGTNWDKRGQTRTQRDISGQLGKRPHLGSTPHLALLEKERRRRCAEKRSSKTRKRTATCSQ